MLVRVDVELFARSDIVFELPFVEKADEPLVAEQVAEDVLQLGAVARGIAIEHLGHHPFEDKHSGKHKAAVALAFLGVERAVGQDLAQVFGGEKPAQLVVERSFPLFQEEVVLSFLLFSHCYV